MRADTTVVPTDSGSLAKAVRWIAAAGHRVQAGAGRPGPGCGTAACGCQKLDPPPTVDWYDIDFPEVLVVRRQVLPQRTDAHDVGSKLNRRAQALMRCQSRIAVIPGATHLFEEPGTLERAAADACAWFTDHLVPTPQPMA